MFKRGWKATFTNNCHCSKGVPFRRNPSGRDMSGSPARKKAGRGINNESYAKTLRRKEKVLPPRKKKVEDSQPKADRW